MHLARLAASTLALLGTATATAATATAEEAVAPARSGAPTWYAQALTRGSAGLNVTHFWSKGAMLRSETVVAGHKIVTIVAGEWYYAYDLLSGEGLAIQREPATVARDQAQRRPFGNEYEILIEQGAEKIREEELMGRPTGVYRVTDGFGKRELWVTQDDARIPLRLEVYDRESASRRYTDYVNWQSDLHIPASFFEPDSAVAFERMDHAAYLKRSADEGPLSTVPVLYTRLLFSRERK